MEKSDTLKPCPFCGGAAEISGELTDIGNLKDPGPIRIGCNDIYCAARPVVINSREMAVNAWNHRH